MSKEMKKKIITLLLIIFTYNFLDAQNEINSSTNFNYLNNYERNELFKLPRFDSRRITGLAYSSLIPGSGQIYLGHTTKGAAIAVGFFTGLVGAMVSQNNFIGNRERIQTLQYEYLNSDRFTLAEYYWKQMVSVHNEQKTHEKSRNLFALATAIIWSVNIIDYLFFTTDKGPIEFSLNPNTLNDSFIYFTVTVPLNK